MATRATLLARVRERWPEIVHNAQDSIKEMVASGEISQRDAQNQYGDITDDNFNAVDTDNMLGEMGMHFDVI
jgi:hypothetical protein